MEQNNGTWRLFVKVLANEPPSLHVIEHKASSTVGAVLAAVEASCDEPAANLALVYDGTELPAKSKLHDCGLSDGVTVHVICRRRTLRLRENNQSRLESFFGASFSHTSTFKKPVEQKGKGKSKGKALAGNAAKKQKK